MHEVLEILPTLLTIMCIVLCKPRVRIVLTIYEFIYYILGT